jgi:hypothetical protein
LGWFEWFLQVIEKNLATKHIAAAAMDLSHDSTVLASNSFYEFSSGFLVCMLDGFLVCMLEAVQILARVVAKW